MMSVPRPDSSFRWSTEAWGLALRCVPLHGVAQHLFTSAQLEFTRQPGDQNQAGSDAWALAAGALGATAGDVVRVRQVHGRVVRVVRRGERSNDSRNAMPDGDAIVCAEPGLVLAVVVADCVPILLADAKSGTAAAVHAGWRGTCAGIAAAAVETMAREFGTAAHDLTAAIGPSIGPDDYEVGGTVVEAFREAGHDAGFIDRWFVRRAGETVHLDLWQANRDQLEAAGVPAASINTCGLSTFAYPGLFESYRRDGPRAGRMAAMIQVPGDRL
jgi:YfiH family protein